MRLPRTALVVVGTASIVVAGLAFSHLITHAVSDDALPDQKKAQLKALFNDSGTTERNRLRDPASGDKPAAAHDSAVPVVNRPREGVPLDISPDEAKRRGEVLSAVKQHASINCRELPLSKAIREITAKLPVRVKFDEKAIKDDGTVSLDDPVTHSTENEPVESILFDLLHPRGLTWIPRGDSLVVTSQTEADIHLDTIAYDVTDLVTDVSGNADFSDLLHMLQRVVQPDEWEDVGGAGWIVPMARNRSAIMVVNHSSEIHREVADFLESLRSCGLGLEPPANVTLKMVPLRRPQTEIGPVNGSMHPSPSSYMFDQKTSEGMGAAKSEPADSFGK